MDDAGLAIGVLCMLHRAAVAKTMTLLCGIRANALTLWHIAQNNPR